MSCECRLLLLFPVLFLSLVALVYCRQFIVKFVFNKDTKKDIATVSRALFYPGHIKYMLKYTS